MGQGAPAWPPDFTVIIVFEKPPATCKVASKGWSPFNLWVPLTGTQNSHNTGVLGGSGTELGPPGVILCFWAPVSKGVPARELKLKFSFQATELWSHLGMGEEHTLLNLQGLNLIRNMFGSSVILKKCFTHKMHYFYDKGEHQNIYFKELRACGKLCWPLLQLLKVADRQGYLQIRFCTKWFSFSYEVD